MKALSLFSGIGGIDLACEWAGIETVAFCEREPFPQKVLKKHWPNVPIYDDVCTLTKERLEQDAVIIRGQSIDLIHGGFPCQPFSAAGKQKGREDDRDLWPEMFRVIRELKPTWVLGENVANFVNMELERTLTDLESEGYEVQSFLIPACGVDAKHQRFRVFVVAYCNSNGQRSRDGLQQSEGDTTGECTSNSGPVERVGAMANANCEGLQRSKNTGNSSSKRTEQNQQFTGRSESGATWTVEPELGGVLNGFSRILDGHRWPAGPGLEQHEWEPARTTIHRIANRKDRLKSLGNAVVPQQIYPILAAIKQINDLMTNKELFGFERD